MKITFILIAIFCTLHIAFAYKNVYFLDKNLPRLVHFKRNAKLECDVFGDENIIQEIIEKLPATSRLIRLDSTAMNAIIDACNRIEVVQSSSRMVDTNIALSRSIIFPGTKWCGEGTSASNYDDLGVFKEPDMCCREHDHCPEVIKSGQTKYGLTNKNIGTVSHCVCDNLFYDCLKSKEHSMANKMGRLFFDVLGQQCFKLEHPIVKCLKSGGIGGKQCQAYELDYTQEKYYQFFDAKLYKI